MALRDRSGAPGDVLEPGPHVDGAHVERYGAGFERGERQEVGDEASQSIGLADDVLDERGAVGAHEMLTFEDLRGRPDDGRRCLQLMRSRRHEAPFGGEGFADGDQGAVRDDERDDDGPEDAEHADDGDADGELPLETVLEGQVEARLCVDGAAGDPSLVVLHVDVRHQGRQEPHVGAAIRAVAAIVAPGGRCLQGRLVGQARQVGRRRAAQELPVGRDEQQERVRVAQGPGVPVLRITLEEVVEGE